MNDIFSVLPDNVYVAFDISDSLENHDDTSLGSVPVLNKNDLFKLSGV